MNKISTLTSLLACGMTFMAGAAVPAESYTLSDDGKTLEKWSGTETAVDFSDDDVLKNIETIGAYAFQNASIESITFNEGLTTIDRGAFMDCHGLTSVTLPSSLTTLGNAAFSTCTSLQSVTFPDALSSIGISCFYNCESLTTADLGNTAITEIPAGVFNSCKALTSATMPPQSIIIGEEAFYMCTALESFIIPDPVQTIDASAFSGCVNLKDVTFNPALAEIGNYAFEATAIKALDLSRMDNLSSIGSNAFSECDEMTTLLLPENEPWFGTKAFNRCSALKEVVIPDSYSQVSAQMFYYCTGLEKVTLGKEVATIKNGAFFDCTSLKEIVWNEKLSAVEWSVFFECNSLESVELPESVTSLDDYAFNSCALLSSVTIGSKMESIGQEAFSMLPSLKQMTVRAVTPPTLGSYAFYQTDVANCALIVPAESIPAYAAAEQWKDFGKISEMASVESIAAEIPSGHTVTGGTSQLTIKGLAGGEHIRIFTIDGRMMANTIAPAVEWERAIPAGIYIVAVGNTTSKVIVK